MKLLNKQFLLKQAGIHLNKLPRKSFARLIAALKAYWSGGKAAEAIKEEELPLQPSNRSGAAFSDAFEPYKLVSQHPGLKDAGQNLPTYVGMRDIVRQFKGKVPEDELNSMLFNYYMKSITPEEYLYHDTYSRYGWNDINVDPSRLDYNARGADALQYLMWSGSRPSQRWYTATMPVKGAIYQESGFSPKTHDVQINPTGYFDPAIIGHELGHAIDDTRYKPFGLMSSSMLYGKGKLNEIIYPGGGRFTDRLLKNAIPHFENNENSEGFFTVLDELNANHQFMRNMQRALQDNPQLYNRYKRYAERVIYPSFATYIAGNDKAIRDEIPHLPGRLQRTAERYMNIYDRYKDRAYDYVNNNGGFKSEPEFRDLEAINRYKDIMRSRAIDRDPFIYDDLYNYAVQKGMRVDPNAWYNTPIGENTRPIDFIINWAPPVNPNVEGLRANYGNPNKAVGAESTSLSNAAQSSY